MVRQRRPWPREDRRGDRAGSSMSWTSPAVPDGPPEGVRAARRGWSTSRRPGFDHVFFTNSGSESVDTALKIALAYHRATGQGRARCASSAASAAITASTSAARRSAASAQQPQGVRRAGGGRRSPAPHARPARNAFSRGEPEHGAELADDLERLVDPARRHRPSPPSSSSRSPARPACWFRRRAISKRLRAICAKHGILLIFDEVITGFGRLGAPFGAEYFGVTPDIITTAKGITNGAVPMGAVFVQGDIHDAFMTGPEDGDRIRSTATPIPAIRSPAPRCIATLDIYRARKGC